MKRGRKKKLNLTESDIEWMMEAKSEGYTWKQLAAKMKVSVSTLKKEFSPGFFNE